MDAISEVITALSQQIPISLFDKGKAGEIFASVKKAGTRIVLKNNQPECILVSPQKYKSMVDEIEDLRDYRLAMERMSKFQKHPTSLVPQDTILKENRWTEEDLSGWADEELE